MMPQTPSQMPQASAPEFQHEMHAPPQAGYGYEYTDQYMEAMAQRLAPRLMAMLRNQASIPTPGQRLALAIVSIALTIPLISIVTTNAILALGLTAWLIVAGLICVTVMVVNIVFNGGIFTRR
jgi:hypothetical protein